MQPQFECVCTPQLSQRHDQLWMSPMLLLVVDPSPSPRKGQAFAEFLCIHLVSDTLLERAWKCPRTLKSRERSYNERV